MFIVLEGIDGSGKTTVAGMLAEYLRERGHRVFLTEEPTTTWLGEAVRRGIREEKNPLTQALLFFADRAEHVQEIRKHLENGEIVVCDRYIYSTYAYQGVQLSQFMSLHDALEWLESIYEPMRLEPDAVFLLTTTPARGLGRIKERSIREKFEREEFLTEVQKIYLMLAEKYGFYVVNSDAPLAEVLERVREQVEALVER